jgi:hypothetical protein
MVLKRKKVCDKITIVAKPAQSGSTQKANQTVTVVKGNNDGTMAPGIDLLNKLGQGASPNSNVNQFSNNSINQTFIIGQQVPVPPQEPPAMIVPSTQSIQPSYTNMLPTSLGLNSFPTQTQTSMWMSPTPLIGVVPTSMGVANPSNVPMMQTFMQPAYQQQYAMHSQMQWQQAVQSQVLYLVQQDIPTISMTLNSLYYSNPQFYSLVHQNLLSYAQVIQNHEIVDFLASDTSSYRKKKFQKVVQQRPEEQNMEVTPETFALMFQKFMNEQGAGEQGSQQTYPNAGVV